jgi:mannose-1-phosphate guanylyltransferase
VSGIVFAAGVGKRLRPLTSKLAKPALPVLDVPLGAWGLARLLRSSAPVVVNVSHLPETIEVALGATLGRAGWETFVEEPEGFGTAGTLRALRDRFDATVITHNGDLICDVDISLLLRAHRESGAIATAIVRPVDEDADMEVEGDRVVASIDRRAVSRAGWQFVGVAAFEPAALELLPDDRPAGLGETLLRTLVDRGELAAHRFHGYALDVGTPARYMKANLDLLSGIAPAAPIPLPGAIVEVGGGLAHVGPEASVSHESLGPGAIVMAGARVHPSAYVSNAIVWPNESVSESEVVSDCIWGPFGPVSLA